MPGFSLKQNQDTYNFDLTGSVTLNGNAIGKWTTNKAPTSGPGSSGT